MPDAPVSHLLLVTVTGSQAERLREQLTREGFYFTEIDSSGGLIYETTESLLIGVPRPQLARVLDHIRRYCQTQTKYLATHVAVPAMEIQPLMVEAEVGGATVYVLDVERFVQI